MDVLRDNSRAWDAEVGRGNRWTIPASADEVARARSGDLHALEDMIGGQVEAGLAITGFYEDVLDGSPCDAFLPVCLATRAVKTGCASMGVGTT